MKDRWEFQFTAKEVQEAALGRCKYHTQRTIHWTSERIEAEEKLRAQGIQIEHHSVTGGSRVTAKLDPTIADRLAECERKIEWHRAQAKEYERWAGLLSRRDDVIQLTYDDAHYFNLLGSQRGKESDAE